MITRESVQALREKTGISVMQCKKALETAGGNIEKALEILKQEGAVISAKKEARELGAGVVGAYVHSTGDVGAMLELLCETDFVAKNEEFKAVARDLAMHIAALPSEGKEELLKQEFVKDPGRTIQDVLNGLTQKFGEKTALGNYTRFSILGR